MDEVEVSIMPEKTNAGIITVTNILLGQMLGLPKGHKVLRVLPPKEHTFKSQQDFEILIEGPDLPLVCEGEIYPHVDLESDAEWPPFKSRIVV